MTKYKFDGQEIEATTSNELVTRMHEQSWSQSDSDKDFMHAISDRLVVQSSIDVRIDTADHFIEDLIKYGVLQEVQQ